MSDLVKLYQQVVKARFSGHDFNYFSLWSDTAERSVRILSAPLFAIDAFGVDDEAGHPTRREFGIEFRGKRWERDTYWIWVDRQSGRLVRNLHCRGYSSPNMKPMSPGYRSTVVGCDDLLPRLADFMACVDEWTGQARRRRTLSGRCLDRDGT